MRHSSKIYFLLLFVITLFSQASAENTKPKQVVNKIFADKAVWLQDWYIAKDIAPDKPLPGIPDSLWISFDKEKNIEKYSEGNWLAKIDVEVEESVTGKNVLGIFPMYLLTAYEIYWDGIKVAQNGTIGTNRNAEKAGTFNYETPLSSHFLTPGKHTIILRLSNYHDNSPWKWFSGGILIGPYKTVLKNIYRNTYQSILVCGILLIPFLFFLFLFFARKKRIEHLLFALICLIVILDHLVEQITMLANISTIYMHWVFYLYRFFTVIINVLFPAFFIYMFSFPKKLIAAVVLIDIIILPWFIFSEEIYRVSSLTVLIISGLLVLWALFQKKEGSKIIFIGIILAWAAYFFGLPFASLATVMAVCTSISTAQQFAGKEKAEREARLKSAHLENELLKKNINPHFLLNSLTSIIAWLRRDPASATKLIEALADEFRMISQISSFKLIPLKQEIDLCKSHLAIMSYRKGADFNLNVIDVSEENMVPPMIFHTLIENGLSHGYENKDTGTFGLQQENIPGGIRYIITDDGDFTDNEKQNSTGLGIKYIKSRLEESYPDRWKFISNKSEHGWETIIEIKDN